MPIDAFSVSCAQLTRDLLAIAKFLVMSAENWAMEAYFRWNVCSAPRILSEFRGQHVVTTAWPSNAAFNGQRSGLSRRCRSCVQHVTSASPISVSAPVYETYFSHASNHDFILHVECLCSDFISFRIIWSFYVRVHAYEWTKHAKYDVDQFTRFA